MEYQVRALETVVDESGIDIPLVIVNEPNDPDIGPEAKAKAVNDRFGIDTVRAFFDVFNHERAWTFVLAEKKLAEQVGFATASSRRVHVDEVSCLSDAETHHVTPIGDGSWSKLPPDTVDLVQENCDVAIRFGFGLLGSDILHTPEFGVLSFHPADVRRYRGLGTPQAWLDGCDTMGVTLQRLNDTIDGGEIVAYEEIDVSECATLWDAYEKLYELHATLLADGIRNLRNPLFEATVPESLGPYYSIQSRRELSFAGRTLFKNITGRIMHVTEEVVNRSTAVSGTETETKRRAEHIYFNQ
jgi:folate-dependent phosphoribosylglycinamide formyltransferase PurN